MSHDKKRAGFRIHLAPNRKGAMLAFVGVALVGLLGAVAIVVDSGSGYRQRRIAQTSADAGALAGAHEISRLMFDSVLIVSEAESMRNGFTDPEVVAHYPPVTGPFAGNTDYVEVLITRNTPTFLAHLFNRSSWDIKARAVAGISTTSLGCVYSLAPTGVSLVLDGRIEANCGVAVNSNLDAKSGARIVATGIAVTGAVTGGNAQFTPNPSTGAAAPLNPLHALDAEITTYLATRVPPTGACDHAAMVVVNADMTLSPGVYCGGIRVTTGSHIATLLPGVYIIAGGGLTVQTSGRIEGTGVTIINTNGPVNNPATYQPYFFGNGAKCNLSAPTTGDFAHMLIIQDPNAGVTGTSYVNTFACADDFPLTGTIYLPTQTAYFQGSNSSSPINGSLIAYKVDVASGTTLTMNQPVTGGSAVLRVSLVE